MTIQFRKALTALLLLPQFVLISYYIITIVSSFCAAKKRQKARPNSNAPTTPLLLSPHFGCFPNLRLPCGHHLALDMAQYSSSCYYLSA